MKEPNILRNILVMLFCLLVIGIIIIVAYLILSRVLGKTVKGFIKIADFYNEKTKSKYKVVCIEISIIVITVTYIILFAIFKNMFSLLVLFTYIIIGFYSSLLLLNTIEKNPNAYSIFNNIKLFSQKKSFISYQLSLLIKTFTDKMTIILIPLLCIIYATFSILQWPKMTYFYAMILIPLFINFWINFHGIFKLIPENEANFRRTLAYAALILLIMFCQYDLYQKGMGLTTNNNKTALFINIGVAVFIAIERLTKSITDGIRAYAKENINTQGKTKIKLVRYQIQRKRYK